ncbi:G-protein beta WD-40 repeat containing protein [Babesia caballi]|uniref:Pre-mRNA-processing factor 17 n=1 Tax=Babesia caballi TaxID=5871 RepID=A0AAV4LLT0_BABCB|nr:G-protein beta WD-40 repeat containing protein [Babesia caballi]
MDALGSYDSDEDRLPSAKQSSPQCDTSTQNGTTASGVGKERTCANDVECSASAADGMAPIQHAQPHQKRSLEKQSPHAAEDQYRKTGLNGSCDRFPDATDSSHNGDEATSSSSDHGGVSQPSSSYAHVDTMDPEAAAAIGSLSSRIHSSYHRSNLEKTLGGAGADEDRAPPDPGTALAVSTEGSTGVLSVQLGSRSDASGVLCVRGADADSATAVTVEERSERELENLEAAARSRMKSCLREHTRNAEDMVMANYPIDHPMHKSMSVVTQKALESYGKVGKSFMPFEADSVGGVFVTPSGMTEKTYVDEASFDDQLRHGDRQVALAHLSEADRKRRRRLSESEVEGENVFGPWVPYEEVEQPVADVALVPAVEEAARPKLPAFEANTRKMPHAGLAFPSCAPDVALPLNEVVVEEGKQETRYDGVPVSTYHRKVDPDSPPTRSWLLPPKNLKLIDPENHKTFIPKREVHTYTGHTMAVQAIRYVPSTGHCLLSASMDGFVKIWDANNNRRCLRTYKGHCKGVRDITFANPEGTKFYSCGFDSTVVQWDTEYGKVVGVYAMEATPFCVTVYPHDEGVFIVGGANKKACQFDARTGKVSLEYNAHQSNVNTVTFFDEGRKLVTTGDDRRLAVWEYNIPVAVKQLADPSMHSMPAVVAHPSEKFVLAQAMSNQILVYESSGSRFRFFGGKRFKGHLCSGYAIRPACSPDGRYVVSGDVRGRVFLWDWKTCRNLATLPGHKSVTMDCQWHPIQPSRLATCSWDGTIKLWD